MISPNSVKNKNVINTVLNFLPDNRPITNLIIVENCEKCPKNFTPIHLTYDQDSDADLWRETSLFGKHPGRYLCMSKQDTSTDTVVETISVIGANERTPEGFTNIKQTTDNVQKAWRKRQLVFKVVERKNACKAVTDIIICSKSKKAPSGFLIAGEINGLSVCYKVGPASRPLPQLPPMENKEKLLPPMENLSISHIYENTSPQLPSRPAPKPPTTPQSPTNSLYGTLGGATYAEIEGVPFVMNPNLNQNEIHVPAFKPANISSTIEYDFTLERQILCTTKAISLTNNPFFH
ncbi:multivesicular body subunit 12B [Phlebotomus papatasi]|uniref:multivesicular body subunit 12B n=1 Tax=Phlebotomus papatasi TaxID=29031 RepID=UPI0024840C6F|nr:multivesicular body subunit 12B [Phlebotomus papatasi]